MCKDDNHRFFCPGMVGIESEGIVCVPLVCTSCGTGIVRKFKVSERAARLTLADQKSQKEN